MYLQISCCIALNIVILVNINFSLKELCCSQECTTGTVDRETFKKIYAQFFPYGGKSVG